MAKTLTVGIVGCGDIARKAYVPGVRAFHTLALGACADLNPEAAASMAADLDVPAARNVEALLADPGIDIILNLTPPQGHAPINLMAINAGKHVYTEKPFALNREDGRNVLRAAVEKGVRVGGAPDTFLGAGLQTCGKLIDDGWIGKPLAATAFMLSSGPESWHPNPDFFYAAGGGPLLDMGPYYLTALVSLLGPIKTVCGLATRGFSERIVTRSEDYGRRLPVEVTTHQTASLAFASGVAATLVTSFDVKKCELPRIEIYGSEGTLQVPDPNTFGGPVRVFRSGQPEAGWQEFPLVSPYHKDSRGIGVADMAAGILTQRPHRASGDLAFHVLDAMLAVDESSARRAFIDLESQVERPAAMPMSLHPGQVDA